MSDKENEELNGASSSSGEGDDSRMHILSMIESGQIDVEEGLKRLQDEESQESQAGVLSLLESGEIDVGEAIRIIENETTTGSGGENASVADNGSTLSPSTEKLRSWWLLIPAVGFVITAFGGWLGTVGGWWWILAGPSLLVGILILLFAGITQNSPWLHVRVNTGQESWPRRIALSFPVPIRLASWGLRRWGRYAKSLDATAVDELLLSLEGNLSADNPILIEVNEDDESGEKIQVYLG
jgi:hypothetical protein